MTEASRSSTARSVLATVFGFDAFRPGQAEVIESVLSGQDTLALMPNGAGKSLCYQLPALLLDGCVVVISPLIALMKDQMDAMPAELARVSRAINSSLTRDERQRVLDELARGRLRLVYAAPERLRQRSFLAALSRAHVSLFVVDEAHCVSLWGHDFRPDYLFIREALRMLGEPPLLALTGTATADTAEEIAIDLGRRLTRVSTELLRPNLHLSVEHVRDTAARQRRLRQLCQRHSGSTIVYVNSHQRTEQLAQILRQDSVAADYYHAGLVAAQRNASQDRFMANETRVIVSTVGLGLGVDKRDVRLVIHYDPPPSLEAYVQGAGRAGRDGEPASCIAMTGPQDRGGLSRWLYEERPGIEGVRALDRSLRHLAVNQVVSLPVDDLIREVQDDIDVDLDETQLRVAVSVLERAGLANRYLDGPRAIQIRVARGPADEEFRAFVNRARIPPGSWLPLDASELEERSGIPLRYLEGKLLDWQARGWMAYRAAGQNLCIGVEPPASDSDQRILRVLDRIESAQERRLQGMFAYLESKECRHVEIARYFSVAAPEQCAACDQCTEKPPAELASTVSHPGTSLLARVRAAMAAFRNLSGG